MLRIISTFTTLSASQLSDDHVLKAPPTLLDDIALAFLAESLRGYAKQYQEDASVKAAELRKGGLTVAAVIELIHERTGAE